MDDFWHILRQYDIQFVHKEFTTDRKNIYYVRKSRIAPAIAGRWQVQVNYLPCRMFKNISYGQLGITNVRKFKDILGAAFIEGNTIEKLVETGLSLTEREYLDVAKMQQAKIQNHTYLDKWVNILTASDM